MNLQVVGAGLGRTGTNSLKLALERLLGGRCYHMYEAAEHDEHTPLWQAAVRGERIDWDGLLGHYVASVDWPACAFWRELHEANRGSFVLLSTRESPSSWWESMAKTIVPRVHEPADPATERRRGMTRELLASTFTERWQEREPAIEAYERHNEQVRRTVAHERLIDWQPPDGWGPICVALGLAVPDEPFPHVNTAAEFRSRTDHAAEAAARPHGARGATRRGAASERRAERH